MGSIHGVQDPFQGVGQSSLNKVGSYKGKKTFKLSNPFKYILKAVTSPFSKPPKSVMKRSVSLPDISPRATEGMRRTVSFSSFTTVVQPQPVAHPKQFTVPEPVRGSDGHVDNEATAKNIIQQLNVLVMGAGRSAGSPQAVEKGFIRLDPKSLAAMFSQVLSQPLATDNLKGFSERLADKGPGELHSIHQEMQKQADSLIDQVFDSYPKLARNLAREDKAQISRDAQSAAFNTMQKDVWVTKGVDEFAESTAPDFEWLARRAKSPDKAPRFSPQHKPPVAPKKNILTTKPKQTTSPQNSVPQKGIHERSAVQAPVAEKTLQKGQASAKLNVEKKRDIQPAPQNTTSSVSPALKQPAVPAQSEVAPKLLDDVKASVTPQAVEGQLTPGGVADTISVYQNLLDKELQPHLSKDHIGVTRSLFTSLVTQGATNKEAETATLAYRDAVLNHKLNSDLALTVGVEVYNWLTDEQDYVQSEVIAAGGALAERLALNIPEREAVDELTQWLDEGVTAADDAWDEEWEQEGELSPNVPSPPPPPPP
ncbi:hypothetical protein, partial [Sansalvadorimonas verongulae]|uniref:hypothetical protein n=1 Tax=Sansalvadorimonas verongulae TaxID=2172824 RepID=UPI0012BC3985